MFTIDKKNKIYLTAGDNAELEICVFDMTGGRLAE